LELSSQGIGPCDAPNTRRICTFGVWRPLPQVIVQMEVTQVTGTP